MDISKAIEKQKVVMGYPSMTKQHNQHIIPHQQTIHSSYNNDPNNVSYSQKYKPLQDQIVCNPSNKSWWISTRYIMIIMPIVVIGLIACGLIFWTMFGTTEKANFQLVSLQVPTGLQITNTSMIGNWHINVTVGNPNDGLDMNFMNQGKIAIFYETNLLVENDIDPFGLKEHTSISLFFNMTTSPETTVLDKGILTEADGNKNKEGILKFAIQTNLKYYITSPGNAKKETIRIYCNDLKVQFGHGPRDKGELIKAENIDCVKDVL